jgi:hypothetical protein
MEVKEMCDSPILGIIHILRVSVLSPATTPESLQECQIKEYQLKIRF